MSGTTPHLLGGRYEVGELIGRGGMAEVHLGHDTRLGRTVAIKILRTDHARDASFLHRFRREAQSVAGLNHNSIVAVYDSGEDHVVETGGASVDVPYIVMEYVPGKTLRTILNERGRLAPTEAARVTEGVLDALAYSHRMGIVHRDIKPANVMVAEDGSVKVMDFGIARAVADTQATMTQAQTVIGTAQYLSPEQAEGRTVDARSDLYSTGCLLFELLTGETPFNGDPIALTYQHVGKPAPSPSSINPVVPPEMDAVVLHALTKDRDARYQDAATFRADLQAARLGLPISSAARRTLSVADAGAAAALGAGAGAVGASAVNRAEATEVLSPNSPQAQTTQQYQPAYSEPGPPTSGYGDTTGYPARRDQQPQKRRGAGTWVALAMALIAALALLGFAGYQFLNSGSSPKKIAMIDVTGQIEAVAKARLADAGFTNITVEKKADDTVPEGKVSKTDPVAGTQVEPTATVVLTVSSGPGTVAVPPLEGMTKSEAEQTLKNAGLKLGTVSEVDSPDHQQGEVVTSDPAEGTSVSPGDSVDLQIATGTVALPNYVGQPYDQAQKAARALGFKVTSESAPSSEPQGTVIGQDPGPGQKDVGSEVHFIVAAALPTSTTTSTSTTTTTAPPTSSSTSTTSSSSTTTSTQANGTGNGAGSNGG